MSHTTGPNNSAAVFLAQFTLLIGSTFSTSSPAGFNSVAHRVPPLPTMSAIRVKDHRHWVVQLANRLIVVRGDDGERRWRRTTTGILRRRHVPRWQTRTADSPDGTVGPPLRLEALTHIVLALTIIRRLAAGCSAKMHRWA
jgi:hypothetical protein